MEHDGYNTTHLPPTYSCYLAVPSTTLDVFFPVAILQDPSHQHSACILFPSSLLNVQPL